MFKLIRSVLFLFDPEKIHYFTAWLIRTTLSIPGMKTLWTKRFRLEDSRLKTKVFGIEFDNPVGLAAGFDKNASMFNDLAYCGFGFIEIGTVTPLGQPGNEKPRLYRLKEDAGIINRMGFNNDGVDNALKNLKIKKTKLIIGGNIGKNKSTPNEEATQDYNFLYSLAYIVISVIIIIIISNLYFYCY